MRNLIAIATLVVFALSFGIAQEQKKGGQKKAPLSPPADTSVTVSGKKISITYSAPAMRGRKIFGELVPYGKVWRAGANASTTLTTEADLQIKKLTVPAGKYSLYVWPEEKGWQLIVNKQTGQWGTVYNQDQDLGRVPMDMSKTSGPVEKFEIDLSSAGGNRGLLKMQWENTVASVPFTVK